MTNWPKDRRQELSDLREMLVKLSGLNQGSHFIDKVQECIAVANRLISSDLNIGRDSFSGFLVSQAVPEVKK